MTTQKQQAQALLLPQKWRETNLSDVLSYACSGYYYESHNKKTPKILLLKHLAVLKTIVSLTAQKLNSVLTKLSSKILHDFSSTGFWLQGTECKQTKGLNLICIDIYIISLYVNKSI